MERILAIITFTAAELTFELSHFSECGIFPDEDLVVRETVTGYELLVVRCKHERCDLKRSESHVTEGHFFTIKVKHLTNQSPEPCWRICSPETACSRK